MSAGVEEKEPTGEHAAIVGRRMARERALEVANIQGNVIPGFNKDFQTLLFLKIGDGEPALASVRGWLAELTPFVATAEDVLAFKQLFKKMGGRWADARKRYPRGEVVRRLGGMPAIGATWINIAFTRPALERLDPRETARFTDRAFVEGLAQRSADLGDPTERESPGCAENWVVGGPATAVDVVLIVAGDDRDDLRALVARLKESLYPPRRSGLEIVYEQEGAVLPGALAPREHFGFRDGVSQPGVRGRLDVTLGGLLTPPESDEEDQGKPGQDLLWPGEFIFGYEGQDRTADHFTQAGAEEVAAGPAWGDNGSFLVIRRLRQDVSAFHAFLHREAARLGLTDAARFGALCVGRWPSGAPILSTPGADDPGLGADERRNNAFEFEQDEAGTICPFAAHIRKVYPRDDRSDVLQSIPDETLRERTSEVTTQTHRMLRRGIPFGDPYPMAAELGAEDDGERGLLFLAYQTSIVRQFELVTKYLANNPDFKRRGAGYDPIIGQNANGRRRPFAVAVDETEATVVAERDWVIPTGGGYFFAPSIAALGTLSGADALQRGGNGPATSGV